MQERLRYFPLGWAKKKEFNEFDLRVDCDTLHTWIDTTATNPEKIPWDTLVTLLSPADVDGVSGGLNGQRHNTMLDGTRREHS